MNGAKVGKTGNGRGIEVIGGISCCDRKMKNVLKNLSYLLKDELYLN